MPKLRHHNCPAGRPWLATASLGSLLCMPRQHSQFIPAPAVQVKPQEKGRLSTSNSYYLSREWRQRRQQRLEIDNHQCQGCGITAAQLDDLGWPPLQVHHKNAGPPNYTYPSFGHELMSDLLTLCSECHDGITNSVRRQRFKLDPKKQVDPVHLPPPSLSIPSATPKQHVQPSFCSDPVSGREPTVVPQRSDSRSAKYLREGDEGSQQQAQEDRC